MNSHDTQTLAALVTAREHTDSVNDLIREWFELAKDQEYDLMRQSMAAYLGEDDDQDTDGDGRQAPDPDA